MADYRNSVAMTRGPTARKRDDGSPVWPLRKSDLPSSYEDIFKRTLDQRGRPVRSLALRDLAGAA